jgi:hypothetical protein
VRLLAGLIVAVAYATTFALRGHLLPGLVGGVLCGALVFLLAREMQARARRRR